MDKFLELLKQEKILNDQGKLLRDYDETKNDELIKYLTLLQDQTYWDNREKYMEILDFFVNKQINLDQYFQQFSTLNYLDAKSSEMWKNKLQEEVFVCKWSEIDIHINPESRGFGKIIYNLYVLGDLCDTDVSLEMNLKDPELLFYGVSEDAFRFIIEKIVLPKVKKYYNKS